MQILSSAKRLWPYLIPIVILILVIFLFQRMQLHRSETDSDYARKNGNPLPVSVFLVKDDEISLSLPSECISRANPTLRIESNIPNRTVTKTFVRVVEQVSPGKLLSTVDSEPEQLALRRFRDKVANAQAQVRAQQERVAFYGKIRSEGLGLERDLLLAQVDLVKARSELADALAALRESEAENRKAAVVSPVHGMLVELAGVGEKKLKEGGLATLEVIDPLLVECQLPEEKLPFLRLGLDVKASFSGIPGVSFKSKLIRIDSTDKDVEHTVKVNFELANPKGKLLPGLHGFADITNTQKGVFIPSIALINPRYDVAQVMVVDAHDKAHLRQVTTGSSSNGYTLILSGLAPEEKVVVAGHLGLREGDAVSVMESR